MYLESHMGQLRSCVLENRKLQEEIKTTISDAVDGMFLLAQCYFGFPDEKLTTNAIWWSLKSLRKQDQRLSVDEKTEMLSYAYDWTIERIDQQQLGLKQMVVKVLSWDHLCEAAAQYTRASVCPLSKGGKVPD